MAEAEGATPGPVLERREPREEDWQEVRVGVAGRTPPLVALEPLVGRRHGAVMLALRSEEPVLEAEEAGLGDEQMQPEEQAGLVGDCWLLRLPA